MTLHTGRDSTILGSPRKTPLHQMELCIGRLTERSAPTLLAITVHTFFGRGTGTGRIIHGLLDRSKNEKSSDGSRFLGIDNSPHMQERARAAVASADQGHISYQLASALDLKPAVSDSSVDLLLMAVGTISHFL